MESSKESLPPPPPPYIERPHIIDMDSVKKPVGSPPQGSRLDTAGTKNETNYRTTSSAARAAYHQNSRYGGTDCANGENLTMNIPLSLRHTVHIPEWTISPNTLFIILYEESMNLAYEYGPEATTFLGSFLYIAILCSTKPKSFWAENSVSRNIIPCLLIGLLVRRIQLARPPPLGIYLDEETVVAPDPSSLHPINREKLMLRGFFARVLMQLVFVFVVFVAAILFTAVYNRRG